MISLTALLLPLAALAQPYCPNSAGSLPYANLAAGTESRNIPVEHIVVIMQENHSFDNYFGRLNQASAYGDSVDGATSSTFNLDKEGKKVFFHHLESRCVGDPRHDWNTMHRDWNLGRNDQFVVQNDESVIGYYEEGDLPFYYALANRFAIGDRYFASVMSQTFPNRFFLYTGTAFGHIKNKFTFPGGYAQKTIFDLLSDYGISWKYYKDGPGVFTLLRTSVSHANRLGTIANYFQDLQSKSFPQVVFLDASSEGEDEHPSADIQVGQQFVAQRIQELVRSTYWGKSALFLTWDEGGGFFDHVAPPEACVPDNTAPDLQSDSEPGAYDRLGFRVPFVAVSPYAKTHYVSHHVYDHTSILKFIEMKFNLPALTARDANADGLLDLFDFAHPNSGVDLPSGAVDPKGSCKAN